MDFYCSAELFRGQAVAQGAVGGEADVVELDVVKQVNFVPHIKIIKLLGL